jgi:hypothetical protein
MTRQRPHIDEILTAFLAARVKDKTGLRRRRIVAADEQLRRCLEAEGHRALTDGDRSVLDLEREIEPQDAFVRTMHGDDLLLMLSTFVQEPWLPPDRIDRDVQIRYADALISQLVSWRLVRPSDGLYALIEAQSAILRAKAAQRRSASFRPLQP